MGWTASDIPDQTGKVALITGANSGLGLHSAVALAARGAHVLMACRDPRRAAVAVEQVAAVASGPPPVAVQLDLADLGSVRAGAGKIAAQAPVIDLMLLNAGVMAMPRSRTADDFEIHLGTNHLGHFALAGRLIPQVLAAPAPRVVVTSSLGHWAGRIRWNDPNWTRRFYSSTLAYGQSKLANLLFMGELARRADASGSPLLVAAAHPGSAHTNLASHNDNPVVRTVYDLLRRYSTQPAEMGALPQLYAATMPDVVRADYWGPDGPFEFHGGPARASVSRAARDRVAGERLWTLSERLTGVSWPDPLGTS
jgi:NAD(P)-dependent dehydrogenase (short-subunit alcohol dehydrogenase family)